MPTQMNLYGLFIQCSSGLIRPQFLCYKNTTDDLQQNLLHFRYLSVKKHRKSYLKIITPYTLVILRS